MKKVKFVLTEKFVHTPEDLNVTPIMNLFCILIPFLLLTAVFAQTVVIQISLPSAGGGQSAQYQQAVPDSLAVLQFVLINLNKEGIQVATNKRVYPPISIPNWNKDLDLTLLKNQLADILAQYPQQRDVIIVSPDNVRYAVLVQLMDVCINLGMENISLSSPQGALAQDS